MAGGRYRRAVSHKLPRVRSLPCHAEIVTIVLHKSQTGGRQPDKKEDSKVSVRDARAQKRTRCVLPGLDRPGSAYGT